MDSILEQLPDGITILRVDGAINDDNAGELTDERRVLGVVLGTRL